MPLHQRNRGTFVLQNDLNRLIVERVTLRIAATFCRCAVSAALFTIEHTAFKNAFNVIRRT